MSTGSVVAWMAFLVLAPALLWWLRRSNLQRGEDLRTWAADRGWSFAESADDLAGLLTAEAFAPRGVWSGDRVDPAFQGDSHVVRGVRGGREVVGWEHVHSAGTVGQRRPGPVQVVAVRLKSSPAAAQLTPRHVGTRLMAGPSGLPGHPVDSDHWVAHGSAATISRLGEVVAVDTPWPDLAAVRVESGLVAAWFVGQTRPGRIEPVADWLGTLAGALDR